MKLHFLLAGLVAVGLVASQPDVLAHGGGGGGGGGGGRGGGSWHGGGGGNWHGGGGGNWHGGGFHGGRFGHGRFFYHGRYWGYGPGFAFYGYPWWGWYGYPGWGWDYYGYYPYYGYDGTSYDQSDSRGDPPQFNSTRAVQAALAWRGFYSGRIDGAMGPETRSAIRAFQKQQGLPVTGQVDSELSKALQRRN